MLLRIEEGFRGKNSRTPSTFGAHKKLLHKRITQQAPKRSHDRTRIRFNI